MHVWMMRQCRAPRMKHQRCTDLRAQVPGIGSDGTQGLGGNIEQQAVDHRLVVPGDRTDRGGQREDHVVILHGQQVSWQSMAWWIHDNLPYSELQFFPKLFAFNIGWHEVPKRTIYSFIEPRGYLTKPSFANHTGHHKPFYVG